MRSVKLHLFLLCVAGVALLGHQCCDPSAKPQNGKFSPYWADTLTPNSVEAIKERHPNVKALASLSGWSLGDEALRCTTVLPYIELFIKYGDVIDYVNHQFYTDKVRSPKGYLAAFQLRATQFDKDKLLPSYAVNGRGIQGDAFSDALNLLEANIGFDVNGVMIFSADASSSNNYYYERKSQAFLTNSTSV
uniref:Chitinase 2-like n=1 Tax=Populus alba TaxID=43335 RepID=A0A4U5N8I9_POPAL|nr:chitinase 2-like [Populus alba]